MGSVTRKLGTPECAPRITGAEPNQLLTGFAARFSFALVRTAVRIRSARVTYLAERAASASIATWNDSGWGEYGRVAHVKQWFLDAVAGVIDPVEVAGVDQGRTNISRACQTTGRQQCCGAGHMWRRHAGPADNGAHPVLP